MKVVKNEDTSFGKEVHKRFLGGHWSRKLYKKNMQYTKMVQNTNVLSVENTIKQIPLNW